MTAEFADAAEEQQVPRTRRTFRRRFLPSPSGKTRRPSGHLGADDIAKLPIHHQERILKAQAIDPTFSDVRQCGAALRHQDGVCRKWGLAANGYCELHGGLRCFSYADFKPLNTSNNLSTGVYSDAIHPWEKGIMENITQGSVDEEIKMAKLKLRRAYRAQMMWELAHGLPITDYQEEFQAQGMSFVEIADTPENRVLVGRLQNRDRDFTDEILRFTRLISQLERRRKELLENSNDPTIIMMKMKKVIGSDGKIDEEILTLAALLKGMRTTDLEKLKANVLGAA